MDDKNCEILFQYLKSILYDTKIQPLDLQALDAPYQKLGMGLQYLEKIVVEMKEYSEALARGKFSGKVPDRDNFLCENLKNIHANLNHLTWQAKQVAKGDYSQNVSYLGEFSEAFNTMTRQLWEREESLRQEAEREKKHADEVNSYNELLMELIARSEEEILVTSLTDNKVLYCKENEDIDLSGHEIYEQCLRQYGNGSQENDGQEDAYERVWETEDSGNHFYQITTGVMTWKGQKAYVHIIREITEEKNREAKLEEEANVDTLTGIGNRHYFQEKTMQLLASGDGLIFCYCDLDHLKYINDKYGHLEGDWYIRHFSETVKSHIRQRDIFARIGGDEFCLILRNCPKEIAEKKLQEMQEAFSSDTSKPYPKSFSYGIVEVVRQHQELLAEEILERADAVMYEQKRRHKEQYEKEL